MAELNAKLEELEPDQLSYLAKLCDSCERYEDMAKVMKVYVTKKKELEQEQRNLLSVAYKNVVGARRSAWRAISVQKPRSDEVNSSVLDFYKKKIVENELDAICNEVIKLLDDHLINKDAEPDDKLAESQVFYLKMKGDYYRYLAEVAGSEEDGSSGKTKAEEAYTSAFKYAQDHLTPTHPIRLGLALNFSVFYYEIADKKEQACKYAKEAFDEAIAKLDDLHEESYKDSTLIMQLLRDNLTLWTSEGNPGDDEEEEPKQ